jgi:hypothetical protein
MVAPAQAYQPTDDDVYTAWALMNDVYRSYLGYLVWDGPREIEYGAIKGAFGTTMGSYGDACWDLNQFGAFEWDYSCYDDPEYLKSLKIYIDMDMIEYVAEKEQVDVKKLTLFVLAHEFGHHALRYSELGVWDHHDWMASGPDQEIMNRLRMRNLWKVPIERKDKDE